MKKKIINFPVCPPPLGSYQNSQSVRIFGECITSFNKEKAKKLAFSIIEILIAFAVVSTAILAFTPLITKHLKKSNSTNKNCQNGIELREETLTTANFGTEREWHPTDSEGHEAELINTMTITMIGGGGGGGAGYSYGPYTFSNNTPNNKYYFTASDIDLLSVSAGQTYQCDSYLRDSDGNYIKNTDCTTKDRWGQCDPPYQLNTNPFGACNLQITDKISCNGWQSGSCKEYVAPSNVNAGYAGCSVEKKIELSPETEFGTYTADKYGSSVSLNGISANAPVPDKYNGSCADENGRICQVNTPDCQGEAKAGNIHTIRATYRDPSEEVYFTPYTQLEKCYKDGSCETLGVGSTNYRSNKSKRTNGGYGVRITPARSGYGGGGGGVVKFVLIASYQTNRFEAKVGRGGQAGGNGEDTTLVIGGLSGSKFVAGGGKSGPSGSMLGTSSDNWYDALKGNDACKFFSTSGDCEERDGGRGGQNTIPSYVNLVTSNTKTGYAGNPPFNSAKGDRSRASASISGGNGGGNSFYDGGLGGCPNATFAGGCSDSEVDGSQGTGFGTGGGAGSCNKNKCGNGAGGTDGMIKIEYQVKCKE